MKGNPQSEHGQLWSDTPKVFEERIGCGALTSDVAPQITQSAALATNDRAIWLASATRVAHPVLSALSQRKLKSEMPVEAVHGNEADRRKYTHLEALGRLLTGLAPWLESGPEAGKEENFAASISFWLARRFMRQQTQNRRTL